MVNTTIIKITDDFDLGRIAASGQCFRWTKIEPDTYRIIAADACLYITALGDNLYELECSEEDYALFWHDYFDLRKNYQSIREQIDHEQDPFLWEAAENEKGIRILQQNPWEMLITSIITQNRNIPAICRSVELLSESCGELKTDSRGLNYYAFPKPEALAALSAEDLKACKLGYRCRYVHAAATAVADGEIDLNQLRTADEDATITTLTKIMGIGTKVANCVSLFGLHHLDAFPVDVWIKRIFKEQYPDGYPYEKYAPYNGIYQQYMFAYYRHK